MSEMEARTLLALYAVFVAAVTFVTLIETRNTTIAGLSFLFSVIAADAALVLAGPWWGLWFVLAQVALAVIFVAAKFLASTGRIVESASGARSEESMLAVLRADSPALADYEIAQGERDYRRMRGAAEALDARARLEGVRYQQIAASMQHEHRQMLQEIHDGKYLEID